MNSTSTKYYLNICSMLCIVCATVLAGCTDTLPFANSQQSDMVDGIQFNVSTQEMGDLIIGIGSTRATNAESRAADAFTSKSITGENPYGLTFHRMALPYVGIHTKAVHSGSSASSGFDTRASVDDIVNSGENFHDSLSIWGYTDNGTELFNETLLKQIQNWRSAVRWPYEKTSDNRSQSMRFYAIAPSVENLNIEITEAPAYGKAPVFKLTLPETAGEMRDVLYGKSEEINIQDGPVGSTTDDPEQENIGKDNKHIPLTFSHIMTAIRFAKGKIPDNVNVTKITLKNIYPSGTFNPNGDGEWTIIEGEEKYDYELTNLSNNISEENTYIDGQQVLFMIPHALLESEGVTLEVELEVPAARYETDENGNYILDKDGNRKPYTGSEKKLHKVSCKLTGDIWKKGYTVTYKLTIGTLEDGYYLMAESPEALEHNSESEMSGTLAVHSYKRFYDYSNNKEITREVNWKIVGYADSENGEYSISNKPEWLEISGAPGKDGYVNSATYTIAKSAHKAELKHSEVLSANSYKAPNDGLGLDLSKNDLNEEALKTPQTANCYIVNSKGRYCFPFKYQIDNKYYNETYNGGKYELQAKVLWQDAENLIQSCGVLSASDVIQFQIGDPSTESHIYPGNAVIALQTRLKDIDGTETVSYSEWETLWTWHIWLTDEVYPNDGTIDGENKYDQYYLTHNTDGSHIVTLQDYDGNGNKILPVNLGWVPDKDEFGVYEPREVWVKIQQTEGKDENNATAVVCIKQHARQDFITGTSTIYQWGCQIPMPMIGGERKIYDGDGREITNRDVLNLWTSQDNATPYWDAETKTKYDPCPPGFKVPSSNIFTGLSRTGQTELDGSKLNVYPDVPYGGGSNGVASNVSPSAGGYFYTWKFVSEQSMDEHRYDCPLVYFPVQGEQYGNEDTKSNGLYWCADHDDEKKNATILWIHPEWSYSYVGTDENYAIEFEQTKPRSSALPIRPAATSQP